MTLSTSEVAACYSRASASSRVRALTCSCRSARVELSERTAVCALLRLGFVALPRCVFAALRLIVRRRLTEPSHGPTSIHYHTMRSVVHHSTIRCRLAATGQNPNASQTPVCQLPPAADLRRIGPGPLRAKSGGAQVQHTNALLDDLFGAGEQHRRHVDAQRLRRLQIDHQLIFHWRLHR